MDTLGKIFHVKFLRYAHWFMSIIISHMKDHSISLYQARYTNSIVAKYLDTDTVKKSTKFYKTTLPSDVIFTKDYAYTSDEQVENLTREFNIHYRACIGSLIYLLSTIVDLSFAVHKLAKVLSNTGKLHFDVLVHLLRYIRENNTLRLNYYADMKDAPLYDLLIQDSINTVNQLMAFSNSSWQDCPDTVRSTGSYMILYQGEPIEHGTHVTGIVAQSSAYREYNETCTTGMALAHFRMLIHELLNKDPDIVP